MGQSHEEFVESEVEKLRTKLRNRNGFMCMCCETPKTSDQAAGVHVYKTENPALKKAMLDEKGRPRVGTYVLCLECIDSLDEDSIQLKVTKNFADRGLFGGMPRR